MGTTFVTIARDLSENCPGFWMRDAMLELWLRLLALHLPESNKQSEHSAMSAIRDQWLLASRIGSTGAVPHGLEEACATAKGRHMIRKAIASLMVALGRSSAPLDANTLNLMCFDGGDFTWIIERKWLLDIGQAFLDLLDGKITCTVRFTEVMPGSIPYKSPAPDVDDPK
jgi:hypothetical protein